MADLFAPAAAPPTSGLVSPLLQQAYQSDPRVALAKAMAGMAQANQNVPAYNPMSALAKAITQAAPAIMDMKVGSDYQDRQKALGDTMKQALAAGQNGIPEQRDESGNVTQAAIPAGYQALASVLSQSSDPVAQQEGMQYGVQGMATAQAAKLALMQKLAEKNLTMDGGGNVIPLPGAGQAVADVAKPAAQQASTLATQQAINTAAGTAPIDINKAVSIAGRTAPIKTQEAINTAAGVAPIEEGKAVNIAARTAPIKTQEAINTAAGVKPIETQAAIATAAGKSPIDAFNEQFKPLVNRVTGAITIPGIENPELVQRIMGAYGVAPRDLGVTPRPPAVAPPAVPGAPQPGAPPPPSGPGAPSVAAPSPIVPAAAGSGAPPPTQPIPAGTKKPIDEVPSVPLPTGEMTMGPGTVSPGRDPIKIKAAEGAVENANKQYEEVADSAKAASQVHAQLGTMRTMLQSGDVNSSATAPARQTLATYLNATLGPDVAKSVTGLDPAKTEIFQKDAVRMGLTFARQTEGAREAVAAIKIALGGNPSLANTKAGNLKIIDLLDAGTQHDMDAQKYGQAYFDKNGHYVGLQDWFSQNHPPAEYTSKVIPYNPPRTQSGAVDPTQLQPNVTYQGKNGPGIWNGHGMVPTQQ